MTHDTAQIPAVRLEVRPADDSQPWTEIFPAQLEWMAKQGHQVRAIEFAQCSREAAIHECAKFVEQHQESIRESSNGSERYLSARKVGNQMGLAYADGIRSLADTSTDRGCGDPSCKDPDCTYGKGKPRCQNCGDPISEIYCGMCREMGCADTSTILKSEGGGT